MRLFRQKSPGDWTGVFDEIAAVLRTESGGHLGGASLHPEIRNPKSAILNQMNPAPMATIPEALAIAIQHHQAGRLPAAEQIYRQILAADPKQPDAWHLLGVLAHQAA